MGSRSLYRAGRVALIVLAACSAAGVAPKVKMIDGFQTQKSGSLYVVTSRDQAAVTESLEKAGFHVTQDASAAAYVLRVEVGTKRASGSCGTVNNVRYALGSGPLTVLEVAARGWTGSCTPNVYDDMSAALARAFPTDAAR